MSFGYRDISESAVSTDAPVRKKFLVSFGLVQAVGASMMVLLTVWLTNFGNPGFGWDAGKIIYFHPVMMCGGLIFMYGKAALIYRLLPTQPKLWVKIGHAVLHILALAMAITGLVTIVIYKNKNSDNHLFSLHSWIGVAAFALFAGQWLCGLLIFLYPGANQPIRAAYLRMHRFWGVAIFALACAAAVTGIAKMANNIPDYDKLSSSALTMNSVGGLLLLFAIGVVYLLSANEYRRLN